MNRGAWWATVHGVAKSRTELTTWFIALLGTGPDLALWGHLSPPLLPSLHPTSLYSIRQQN